MIKLAKGWVFTLIYWVFSVSFDFFALEFFWNVDFVSLTYLSESKANPGSLNWSLLCIPLFWWNGGIVWKEQILLQYGQRPTKCGWQETALCGGSSLFIWRGLQQVWPISQFFLFPFCKRSLICQEGKSMSPHRGLFSFVLPSNSLVSVSNPWRALDSPRALLPELQRHQGHRHRYAVLGAEVPGH